MSIGDRVVGRVRHVLGATVTVELDPRLAGIAPAWDGMLQPIGQIGSIVLLPQGRTTLVAAVSLVGIAELAGPPAPSSLPQTGNRWLQLQLLGEIDAFDGFRRGVSTYPALDDEVLFAVKSDLLPLYPPESDTHVVLGSLSTAADIAVTLDAARLVTRHSVVVGSTGSGKSSTVSSLIQGLAAGRWPSANIVVVDPHGEYAAALTEVAEVRSVAGTGTSLLRVPYWALSASDLLSVLAGQSEGATTRTAWLEHVTEARRQFAAAHEWVGTMPANVSGDSPVPFDVREVWYKLAYENSATYSAVSGGGSPCVRSEGDARALTPPEFDAHAPTNAAPFKGPRFGVHGTVPERIRSRLADPRFSFLLAPDAEESAARDLLPEVVAEWLGRGKAVSVLDFSGVPADVTDVAVGVVTNLLFEVATRSGTDGVGRPSPILIVLEEAHRYLADTITSRTARQAVDRIAREGRKYGVGLMLVTQRPGELPPTSLAQVGTVIAMRLTNASDQATIRAALPDAVSGLADALSALRTGEAVAAGEAIGLPSRILVRRPDPAPAADDPDLSGWQRTPKVNELAPSVIRWRGVSNG